VRINDWLRPNKQVSLTSCAEFDHHWTSKFTESRITHHRPQPSLDKQIHRKSHYPSSSVPILSSHIQKRVTTYSCCNMLISFPNGSRTKNLRTPHGSLSGPYSIGMPAFLTLTKAVSMSSTSIDKAGTGAPDPPSASKTHLNSHL
jgi:hypothetical protein